jgi:hypothetical protein
LFEIAYDPEGGSTMMNLAIGIAIGYVIGRWGKYLKFLIKSGQST